MIKKMILCILILVMVSPSAYSLTTSQHISVSLILEKKADTNLEAFIYGFGSHALLDSIRPQHYNFDILNPTIKDIDIVSLESCLSIYQFYNATKKEKFAILGALAPDLIEGMLVLQDKSRYYEGNHLFPWHVATQKDKISKEKTMLLSLTLISIQF